jgi:hypothetical protein
VSVFWAVVLGAILASLLTTGLLYLVLRFYLRSWIAGLVEEAREDLLPRLRAQVKGGVEDAADKTLPRLRSEVRSGVEEGLSDVKSKVLGKTAGSVIDAGLNVLLGTESKKGKE